MTKEALGKLNDTQRARIESYKTEYVCLYKEVYRCMARAYTYALADCGVLTNREANAVFLYTTL